MFLPANSFAQYRIVLEQISYVAALIINSILYTGQMYSFWDEQPVKNQREYPYSQLGEVVFVGRILANSILQYSIHRRI